jgi:hypothetical protein
MFCLGELLKAQSSATEHDNVRGKNMATKIVKTFLQTVLHDTPKVSCN